MDLKVDFLCSFYGSTISGLSIENSAIDILVKIKENKLETNYLNINFFERSWTNNIASPEKLELLYNYGFWMDRMMGCQFM
jgi:hypothetical protein